jgi:uncharacterized sodium:solute symporter family permease YidK
MAIGVTGSIYAIFGGLRAVAVWIRSNVGAADCRIMVPVFGLVRWATATGAGLAKWVVKH